MVGREEALALAEPVEEVGRVVRRRESAVARSVGLGVATGNMNMGDAGTGRQQHHAATGAWTTEALLWRAPSLRPRKQAVAPSKRRSEHAARRG